jgi:hypothetical protein
MASGWIAESISALSAWRGSGWAGMAPVGAGEESAARSGIACRGRYEVSRLSQASLWRDEQQIICQAAEREHPMHGRWAGADGQVYLLRVSAFGEFDDDADPSPTDCAQPAGLRGARGSMRIALLTMGLGAQTTADVCVGHIRSGLDRVVGETLSDAHAAGEPTP